MIFDSAKSRCMDMYLYFDFCIVLLFALYFEYNLLGTIIQLVRSIPIGFWFLLVHTLIAEVLADISV